MNEQEYQSLEDREKLILDLSKHCKDWAVKKDLTSADLTVLLSGLVYYALDLNLGKIK